MFMVAPYSQPSTSFRFTSTRDVPSTLLLPEFRDCAAFRKRLPQGQHRGVGREDVAPLTFGDRLDERVERGRDVSVQLMNTRDVHTGILQPIGHIRTAEPRCRERALSLREELEIDVPEPGD